MSEARFVVAHKAGERGGRWGYIDACPHGEDMGAVHLGPVTADERTPEDPDWDRITWKFTDLGNGRCRIEPSILLKGVHQGGDCHFGPGEFPFIWLEEGEARNTEPFLSRYTAWLADLQKEEPKL